MWTEYPSQLRQTWGWGLSRNLILQKAALKLLPNQRVLSPVKFRVVASQMSSDTKSNEAHFVWLSLWVAGNNLLSPSASKYGKWIWLSNRKRLQGSGGGEGGGSPAVRPVQGSGWSVPLEVFPPQPASGRCVLPFCFTSRGTVLLHPHSLGWGRGGGCIQKLTTSTQELSLVRACRSQSSQRTTVIMAYVHHT